MWSESILCADAVHDQAVADTTPVLRRTREYVGRGVSVEQTMSSTALDEPRRARAGACQADKNAETSSIAGIAPTVVTNAVSRASTMPR